MQIVRASSSMSVHRSPHTSPRRAPGGDENAQKGTDAGVVPFGGYEEGLGVGDRWRGDLVLAQFGRWCTRRRIGWDPPPSHRLSERTAGHGVNMADRRQGHLAFPTETGGEGIEALGRDAAQRQTAEYGGGELRFEPPALPCPRRRELFVPWSSQRDISSPSVKTADETFPEATSTTAAARARCASVSCTVRLSCLARGLDASLGSCTTSSHTPGRHSRGDPLTARAVSTNLGWILDGPSTTIPTLTSDGL